MFRVVHLKQHIELIEIISKWCYTEWTNEYNDIGIKSIEELTENLYSNYINTSNKIPIILVTLDNKNNPCGTISLLQNDIKEYTELSPWIASLFVPVEYRLKGISKILLMNMMSEIKNITNINAVYLWTKIQNINLYMHYGFKEIDNLKYCGNNIIIMKCNLK